MDGMLQGEGNQEGKFMKPGNVMLIAKVSLCL